MITTAKEVVPAGVCLSVDPDICDSSTLLDLFSDMTSTWMTFMIQLAHTEFGWSKGRGTFWTDLMLLLFISQETFMQLGEGFVL